MGSSRWLACWASNTKFEIKNGLQSFIVDLAKRTCSCRKWDINGIPYCHAISCIFFNRKAAEKYINDCYKVSIYKTCYEPIIDPINCHNMWTPIGLSPVQPPIKRMPLDRPKKKRAKLSNEPSWGHSKGLVLPRDASHVENQATTKEVAKVGLEGILHYLQLLVVVQTKGDLGQKR